MQNAGEESGGQWTDTNPGRLAENAASAERDEPPETGPAAASTSVKVEHRSSKAQRRGPMDEMRQLVRIMIKLFPDSEALLNAAGRASGGNKITQSHIRQYLKDTLGDAPEPEWGLPRGWGQYLADLFNWARGGSFVSAAAARSCAIRSMGKPWQINWNQVHELGIFPERWQLPLNSTQVAAAQNRVPPSAAAVAAAAHAEFEIEASPTRLAQISLPRSPESLTRGRTFPAVPAQDDTSAVENVGATEHGAQTEANCILDRLLACARLLSQRPAHLRGSIHKQHQVMQAVAAALPDAARQFAASHGAVMDRHERQMDRLLPLLPDLHEARTRNLPAPSVHPPSPHPSRTGTPVSLAHAQVLPAAAARIAPPAAGQLAAPYAVPGDDQWRAQFNSLNTQIQSLIAQQELIGAQYHSLNTRRRVSDAMAQLQYLESLQDPEDSGG